MTIEQRAAHFMARTLQDCLSQATTTYWRRRAQTFLDAAPRPGDYNGRASAAELAERTKRCHQAAEVCMQRASIEAPIADEVWDVLGERAS